MKTIKSIYDIMNEVLWLFNLIDYSNLFSFVKEGIGEISLEKIL